MSETVKAIQEGRHLKAALSIDEVAFEIGVCRDGIYTAIKESRLRAVKHGRRTLVLLTDLEEYLRRLPVLHLGPAPASEATS